MKIIAAAAFGLVVGFAGSARADIQCPATLQDHVLAQVSLFDGPPAQLADLIPDDEQGWKLEPYRAPDRELNLVCHYSDTKSLVTLPVPRDLKTCTLKGLCH